MKKFNETYLYKANARKGLDYEKETYSLILKGQRVDKTDKMFNDIKYEVKRKNIDSTLAKLLDSDRIVLVVPQKEMPKAFKVITAKDVKNDRKVKVFIDCTGIIEFTNSGYIFNYNAINILISYLIAARTAFIVEAKPNMILLNTTLTQSGTRCFASLVNYIVNYIGKINVNTEARNKSLYLAAIYYQVNLLGKDIDSKSVKDTALKISGISERQANVIEIDFEQDSFDDIEKFVNLMAESLHVKGLTVDTFIEKWMWLLGSGTIFATELFIYFAQMMSDAYIGAYLNNQNHIESTTGRNMVEFNKTLLKIGRDSHSVGSDS